jgi:hypothetical protein
VIFSLFLAALAILMIALPILIVVAIVRAF